MPWMNSSTFIHALIHLDWQFKMISLVKKMVFVTISFFTNLAKWLLTLVLRWFTWNSGNSMTWLKSNILRNENDFFLVDNEYVCVCLCVIVFFLFFLCCFHFTWQQLNLFHLNAFSKEWWEECHRISNQHSSQWFFHWWFDTWFSWFLSTWLSWCFKFIYKKNTSI